MDQWWAMLYRHSNKFMIGINIITIPSIVTRAFHGSVSSTFSSDLQTWIPTISWILDDVIIKMTDIQ